MLIFPASVGVKSVAQTIIDRDNADVNWRSVSADIALAVAPEHSKRDLVGVLLIPGNANTRNVEVHKIKALRPPMNEEHREVSIEAINDTLQNDIYINGYVNARCTWKTPPAVPSNPLKATHSGVTPGPERIWFGYTERANSISGALGPAYSPVERCRAGRSLWRHCPLGPTSTPQRVPGAGM